MIGTVAPPIARVVRRRFALQHYYLDAKIWRVSRDRDVRKHLQV